MATFVSTIKFTDQGIKTIGETTRRVGAIKSAASKMGVQVDNVYWMLGNHDGVLIFTAPNEETAATFLLHVGSQGNVHTETNRAFTAEEMERMLAKLGG